MYAIASTIRTNNEYRKWNYLQIRCAYYAVTDFWRGAVSIACAELQQSREYPCSWKYGERDREYPCSWKYREKPGISVFRSGERKRAGNICVSWRYLEVSREYPCPRSQIEGIEELAFVAGNVRATRPAEQVWSRSFCRGPFYTRWYGRVWWCGVHTVRARMFALDLVLCAVVIRRFRWYSGVSLQTIDLKLYSKVLFII